MNPFARLNRINDLNKLYCENKITEEDFRNLAKPLCEDELPPVREKLKLTIEGMISDKKFVDEQIEASREFVKECKKIKDKDIA